MSHLLLIAASLTLIGSVPAFAAPLSIAKDGTTNIADCPKVDVAFRDKCISLSRPVTGKQLYADAAAQNALMAKKAALDAAKAVKAAKATAAAKLAAEKSAKAKAPVLAKVVGAPKGFKINKDGTTNVADCAKAVVAVRNECISRARPMNAKQLAKFIKSRAGDATVAATKASAKAAAVKPAAKPVAVVQGPVLGKGFKIAKDGTTNINDCANAKPEFRNECISRARPVTGAAIYASTKQKP